ncbi:protein TolQ [Thiosulfativibrio zosterae]|uniref:Tol-Pal system protein TolQ n=1 Tax=Thiosulfativibrio zosterae TaxID=2675053 RepID=A0A6F8PNS1_9GAMM|nr:protein TolQ [Thiosulfativibrio zosterae]BBP43745.1 protein TolQ [Thiosulfativibrio zosterae]
MNEQSVYLLVLNASPVVQAVMGLLLLMSIAAWAVTFSKSHQIRKARNASQEFEEIFWNTQDLTQLYNQLNGNYETNKGLAAIFEAGFKEFVNLKKQGVTDANDLVAGTQRAMKISFSREIESLENHTPMLATVGSSAPYIGLFGTVWGVMHAFSALGDIQNATLAAVAPGISEALIATAIGLFAAIPAVIAYNRLTNKTERLINQYENFAEGFLTIVQRQAHTPD